jgi:hypothetical protein
MRTIATVLTLGIANVVFGAGPTAPSGWILRGDKPTEYSVTLDHVSPHGGKYCSVLRAFVPKPTGFSTLMQTFSAATYRGKRLRLTAWVRGQVIAGWAGLWMRVDGADGKVLAFDNMVDRPIKGTTEWSSYSVTLDVGDSAQAIAFGILLYGAGSASVDDFSFEVVRNDVPTTGIPRRSVAGSRASSQLPDAPRNLDFEQ